MPSNPSAPIQKHPKRGAIAPVPPAPDETCRYIPLSQGRFALVDASDYKWLNQWNWSAANKRGILYAVRSNGGKSHIPMHREILKPAEGLEIDHLNGDGLDNRRSNLRIASRAENLRHRKTFRNNKSGFKGVTYIKTNGKWKATLNLGTFETPEQAARAYDEVIRKLFGRFAKTNFDE